MTIRITVSGKNLRKKSGKFNFKFIMEKPENTSKENVTVISNLISKLIQDLEQKVLSRKKKAKECEELIILKEKCCDPNAIVSLTAFHGIINLVERRVLIGSQTISTLVSLFPSVSHFGSLVSAIGKILLLDFHEQISKQGNYHCPYDSGELHHPFIMALKYNKEKSWFEIILFTQQFLQMYDSIKLEHKIQLLRPIFRNIFWGPSWRGSELQLTLFSNLMLQLDQKEILHFALEVLIWQKMDIYFCLYLQQVFEHLLKLKTDENKLIISALTPLLAETIKWLVLNGQNPTLWINLLNSCMEIDKAASSSVLYILSDIIMETSSLYINLLIDTCKNIICGSFCHKYVAHKFVAAILNWFVNPSSLANPMYKTLGELLVLLNKGLIKWNDQTLTLTNNKYFTTFGNCNKDVKFAVDLIVLINSWTSEDNLIVNWLANLKESREHRIQLNLHLFIYGIILSENKVIVIERCLEILFELVNRHADVSFSFLCLLFYKLGKETDPTMQRIYLFSLPKLAVKKENIPLILGVIESIKKGAHRTIKPIIVQLYLLLWKVDNRTYPYLHNMLYEDSSGDFSWELNISKALALREICRLEPYLHAKDLIGVLSSILNDCANNNSGLASAIAIEAVTELCKAYIIDASGTWYAIQPKLRIDKRPKIIVSLCKFFGEIPNLSSSEKRNEALYCDIIFMLWNYTFFNNADVVKSAFRALSNFDLENLNLRLFPEIYRVNIKLPNDFIKLQDFGPGVPNNDDIGCIPYVPAECWLQLLEKVQIEALEECGNLIIARIEKELNALPRGFFYLAPEVSEPINYSYLPQRSICRTLVDCLYRLQVNNSPNIPRYIKEILRIISHSYSKLLPPLNWSFLEKFVNLDSEFLYYSLSLLTKQGSVSKSAKSVIEKYLATVQWNSDRADDVAFLYGLLPLLCKFVSFNILQNFLEKTMVPYFQAALQKEDIHFNKAMDHLRQALTDKTVPPIHKTMVVNQLEKILIFIPPEHQAMKSYASCATEFPINSIENITSVKDYKEANDAWLRRAIIIRCAIALRSDIRNPLGWLNEIIDICGHFPSEQNFLLNTLLSIIQNRRDCRYSSWLKELTWRIQASITTSDSSEVTLFLIDVFVCTTLVLSGYDCFFNEISEIAQNKEKALKIFPQSLRAILSFPSYVKFVPKLTVWLQKLSKWKHLPQDYLSAIFQSLMALKDTNFLADENMTPHLFNAYSLPLV